MTKKKTPFIHFERLVEKASAEIREMEPAHLAGTFSHLVTWGALGDKAFKKEFGRTLNVRPFSIEDRTSTYDYLTRTYTRNIFPHPTTVYKYGGEDLQEIFHHAVDYLLSKVGNPKKQEYTLGKGKKLVFVPDHRPAHPVRTNGTMYSVMVSHVIDSLCNRKSWTVSPSELDEKQSEYEIDSTPFRTLIDTHLKAAHEDKTREQYLMSMPCLGHFYSAQWWRQKCTEGYSYQLLPASAFNVELAKNVVQNLAMYVNELGFDYRNVPLTHGRRKEASKLFYPLFFGMLRTVQEEGELSDDQLITGVGKQIQRIGDTHIQTQFALTFAEYFVQKHKSALLEENEAVVGH